MLTAMLASSMMLAACADIFGVKEYGVAPPEDIELGGTSSQAGTGGVSGSSGTGNTAGNGGDATQGGRAGTPSGGMGDSGGEAGSGDVGAGGTSSGMGGPAGAVGGGAGTSSGSAGAAGDAGTSGEGPCGPVNAEWDFENGSVDGFYHYTYPAELDDNTFFAVDETDGTLRVTAGFDPSIDSGRTQTIFAADAFLEEPRDLTGKAVFACVRLVEKLDGASGFPQSTAYVESTTAEITADGEPVLLDDVATWQTISLDIDDPAHIYAGAVPYDPSQIVRLGVLIETGDSGTYGPVVIAIGAVWIEDA
jgi:hypothetical protein